jgi:hypothetical protein
MSVATDLKFIRDYGNSERKEVHNNIRLQRPEPRQPQAPQH